MSSKSLSSCVEYPFQTSFIRLKRRLAGIGCHMSGKRQGILELVRDILTPCNNAAMPKIKGKFMRKKTSKIHDLKIVIFCCSNPASVAVTGGYGNFICALYAEH